MIICVRSISREIIISVGKGLSFYDLTHSSSYLKEQLFLDRHSNHYINTHTHSFTCQPLLKVNLFCVFFSLTDIVCLEALVGD